jgi:mannose-6-phosphate isomerase-like protein (cupin superfamily)
MLDQSDWDKGSELARPHGIRSHHEQMPNGELRFRLIAPDGSSYIRTVAGPQGAWQNSHYHNNLRETYIVETGWIVLAEWDSQVERLLLTRHTSGSIVTTPVTVPHNLYLAANTVLHTVKHGGVADVTDWHSAPTLDLLTKCITEAELLAR